MALFRRFIFVIGIVFIILIIIGLGLSLYIRSYDEYVIDSTVKSPNGEFVATLYSVAGGGGPGYCESMVSVTPSSIPFSVKRNKYDVFQFSCNDKIKLIWKSKHWLVIDISSYDIKWRDYWHIKEKDKSRKVKISLLHNKLR